MNYSKVSRKECWIFLLINVYVGKDLKVELCWGSLQKEKNKV